MIYHTYILGLVKLEHLCHALRAVLKHSIVLYMIMNMIEIRAWYVAYATYAL